jgi:hypothetical protein
MAAVRLAMEYLVSRGELPSRTVTLVSYFDQARVSVVA